MILEELQTLSWADFKRMISDHYCPQSYRDQKEVEFLNLQQGSMKVVEYKRRFNSCLDILRTKWILRERKHDDSKVGLIVR